MLTNSQECEVGTPEPTEPKALTIKQATLYSGLSRSFLYKLFSAGKLAYLKAGKRVLILRTDLDRYLASIRQGGE